MATRDTVVFTLPLHCQICLDKVKQPVVCPNQHAFCAACINEWLTINQQCPACRVPINTETPCKPVIGSLSSTEENLTDASVRGQLRRTRFSLLMKDYEAEISALQSQVEELLQQNESLQRELSKRDECKSAFPSACEENGKERAPESTSPLPKRAKSDCDSAAEQPNLPTLLKWSEHLQTASELYSKLKTDLRTVQQEKKHLQEENAALQRENGRLRQEHVLQSPQRLGRYTAAAQGKQIECLERQVTQLNRALERSDRYITDLEQKLSSLRSQADGLSLLSDGSKAKCSTCSREETADCSCSSPCESVAEGGLKQRNSCFCCLGNQIKPHVGTSNSPWTVQRMLNFNDAATNQSASNAVEYVKQHGFTKVSNAEIKTTASNASAFQTDFSSCGEHERAALWNEMDRSTLPSNKQVPASTQNAVHSSPPPAVLCNVVSPALIQSTQESKRNPPSSSSASAHACSGDLCVCTVTSSQPVSVAASKPPPTASSSIVVASNVSCS